MSKNKKTKSLDKGEEEVRRAHILLAEEFKRQHIGLCGTCKWWSRFNDEAIVGFCEYYPPVTHTDKDCFPYTCWPETSASKRCSKYQS